MEKMKPTIVDSGWSWVIAFSCCLINCLLYGIARLSGLWMVSAVETFQVNRASAALPFSVSTSVRNLSGLFVGYLGQRFGIRVVIATGCLLASLGAGLCFFVTDITWVVFCWGGIFGLGFGLATCLLPLAINQHFDVYRGTASGISYSGSYIGSFLMSPLVIQLLDEYGLSGTLLVLSATLLNGFAVSMFFHKPRTSSFRQPTGNISKENSFLQLKDTWLRLWEKIKSKRYLTLPAIYTVDSSLIYGRVREFVTNDTMNCELTSYTDFSRIRKISHPLEMFPDPLPKMSVNFNRTSVLNKKTKVRFKKKYTKFKKYLRKTNKKQYSLVSYIPLDSVELISYKRSNCLSPAIEKYSFCNTLCKNKTLLRDHFPSGQTRQVNASEGILLQIETIHKNGVYDSYVHNNWYNFKNNLEDFSNGNIFTSHIYQQHTAEKCSLTAQLKNEVKYNTGSFEKKPEKPNLKKDAFKCLFGWSHLYSDPMFVVIAVTMSLHTFVIVCMITIIEDFAKDIRIPECQVHYVLMVLSMADLIGSLTLGAITDRGFLSRLNFIILCFFGMAICQLSISFVRSFSVLLTLVVIYGLFESGIIITFPLLIAHFIPQKKQPTAVASSNFLSSPTVLLVPLVIGFFRDRAGGCYRGVFYCLGGTSLCCCLIWLLLPKIFTSCKKKTPNSQRNKEG